VTSSHRTRKAHVRSLVILIPLAGTTAMSPAEDSDVSNYLVSCLRRIRRENAPPKSPAEWRARRKEVLARYLDTLGLDPPPKKTPLKPRFLGRPKDLGHSIFRRVVFESRPKNYVAAHLHLPKGVSGPVPAIIYTPGHHADGRDGYLVHPLTYAANGFVALSLPALGGEGRRGGGRGGRGCGHKGPYYGDYRWHNTGYFPPAAEVWDTIRAVDYLRTLKQVDKDRIALTGRSGGAVRTCWTAAAEPRIAAVVVTQGVLALTAYDFKRLSRHCDQSMFYNYYGLDYADVVGLIAPRPMLIQHGRRDALRSNRGVAETTGHVEAIYRLYGHPERFVVTNYDQGHEDTPALRADEYAWFDRWLRDGDSPLTERDPAELKGTALRCFPHGPPADAAHIEKQFTPPTPTWEVGSKADFGRMEKALQAVLREKVLRAALAAVEVKLTGRRGSGYGAEARQLTVDGRLAHRAVFAAAPDRPAATVIVLADAALETRDGRKPARDPCRRFRDAGVNLFCFEPTGIGATAWSKRQGPTVHRLAALAGFTVTSLRVRDALAAVQAVARDKAVDPSRVVLWGRGEMAVAALYAAAVSDDVAGVVLEDAPAGHIAATALLGVLRHGDIPQFAGLIFPRKISLTGKRTRGFGWTRKLYRTLGRPEQFVTHDGGVEALLEGL